MREKAKNVMELGPGSPGAASLGVLVMDRRLRDSAGCQAHSSSLRQPRDH